MDDKKKILLGEKDIISKDNEDMFINLNLTSTFTEIRADKYDNVFDVSKQFNKERNASRDFRIYGIIDSTIVDCDNLRVNVYRFANPGTGINSGTTVPTGFIKFITSTPLVYGGYNVYGKKRGKYILELTGYTNDFVYLKIPTNSFSYHNQLYSQQLIFRDAEGNFIDYGTQTIDIANDGSAVEINNDFYFLYNKHWIKKDLLISEEKKAIVSFSATSASNTVLESDIPVPFFNVTLNKPSPFGLEKVTLDILSKTLSDPEIIVMDESNSVVTFPKILTFSTGQQVKRFAFNSPINTVPENTEDVTFELKNLINVVSGDSLTNTIIVTNTHPIIPPLPPILKVSFENPVSYNGGTPSTFTVKVSLSAPSATGTESVVVNQIQPLGVNAATPLFHYTDTQNPMPKTISWALGEKDKVLTFSNVMPIFNNFNLFLNLEIVNLVNVDPGINMNTVVILST